MKKLQKILMISLVIVMCLNHPIYASGSKKGSLTMTYPCEEMEVQLYQVAKKGKGSTFKLKKRFSNYPIKLNDHTKSEWAGQAQTLESYIQRDHLPANFTGKTDSQGKIQFKNLQQGIYLAVASTKEKDGYVYKAMPYFIVIPGKTKNGKKQYQVTTTAKYEKTPNDEEEYTDYKVAKIWIDENPKNRAKSITVQLLRDGEVYEEVLLNDKNNWQHTWEKLSSKYQWSVTEKTKVKDYFVSVSKQGTSFIIKNIYWDDEHYEDTTTTARNKTTKEERSSKDKKTDETTKTTKDKEKELPQTGQLWWPLPFLVFGGILCIGIGMIKQKREDHEKE